MEYLIEILIELILEGSIEISSDEKVPNWIRYPIILFIVLLFTVVIFGMIILGISILKENIYAGLFLIIIGFILLILGIIKFTKKYSRYSYSQPLKYEI